jgi:microcystin-dependent protein
MEEPFLGEIKLVAFDFAPPGWALCDGRELRISQHTALFSLMEFKHGGDGRTTFALPDLRDQPVPGLNAIIAMQGIFPSRG